MSPCTWWHSLRCLVAWHMAPTCLLLGMVSVLLRESLLQAPEAEGGEAKGRWSNVR